MKAVRVRFAPSPTGPLHIGGVRTALYNYLFARKHNGTFILRIEDTDQKRFVEDAEQYILDALKWLEIEPDEGTNQGGDYGPYKQSERSAYYKKYVDMLVEAGKAYYAFDSPAELEAARLTAEKQKEVFKYGVKTRKSMKNSLTLSAEETQALIEEGNYTIRMKIPVDDVVSVDDAIRGKVTFQSEELDDKVIMKADGLPTYHLANVVDDKLMEVSHVIRGEEWLPSTGHHVYLYQFLGWEPPIFAHLPLILKPSGKGKLSKRDGQKLGLPVFPLEWKTETETLKGFKEYGFEKEAVLNFLALLGWNPGTDQEIFTLNQLEEAFELDRIGKSGARFDYDKAKWFNQQYIIQGDTEKLAAKLLPIAAEKGIETDEKTLAKVMDLMQERLSFVTDLFDEGAYFFKPVEKYDEKTLKKKWDVSRKPFFTNLVNELQAVEPFKADEIKTKIVAEMEGAGLKFGQVLPVLRLGLSGTVGGPDVFKLIAFLGKEKTKDRLLKAMDIWS